MDSDENNTSTQTNTGQQPGQQSGGNVEGGNQPTGSQPGQAGNQTTNTQTQAPAIPPGYLSQEQFNSALTARLAEDRKLREKEAEEKSKREQGQFEPLYNSAKAEIETLRTQTATQITAANTERDEIKTTLLGYVKADLLTLDPETLALAPIDIGDKPEEFDVTKLTLTEAKMLANWIAKAKAKANPGTGVANRIQTARPNANRTGPVPSQTGNNTDGQNAAQAKHRKKVKLAF